MFVRKTPNGKYRYYEKFRDNDGKWRQVSITLNSKNRISQGHARTTLALKIDKILNDTESTEKLIEYKTFEEVYNEWSDIRKQEIKGSTFYVQDKSFRKIMKKLFPVNVSEVKSSQIQKLLMNVDSGTELKRKRKAELKMMFDYARAVGYVENNPVEKVILPRTVQTFEEYERSKNKFLTMDEMRQVLKYAYEECGNKRATMVIEFLFLTGIRMGELLALQKKYVNFEDKSIHIAYTLDHTSVREQERKLNSPKTYSSIRDVALNQRCIEIIKYFIDTVPNEEFVFVNECGNIMVTNTVSKHLKKICTDVLGEGRYFLHMLRHSHISMLIEMGLPLRSIMDRVGHKNEKITLQIYSHVTKKMRDTMQEKLEEINL